MARRRPVSGRWPVVAILSLQQRGRGTIIKWLSDLQGPAGLAARPAVWLERRTFRQAVTH